MILKNLNLKHIKIVKEVVDALNNAFPAPKIKIERIYEGVRTIENKQLDDYFYAYFERQIDLEDIWWIVCNDYWKWQDAQEYLDDFCVAITQDIKVKVHQCNVHPTFMQNLQERHNQKKIYLIGKCNWC